MVCAVADNQITADLWCYRYIMGATMDVGCRSVTYIRGSTASKKSRNQSMYTGILTTLYSVYQYIVGSILGSVCKSN